MKLFKILFLFLCVSVTAQSKFSYGLGIGGNAIADQCATLDGNAFALDANATYNFNEKLGLGIYGGYSRLQLDEVKDSNFFRANLELESNVLKLTNLQTDKFVLLVHGGPGLSYNSATSELMPNISGGTDLFYMLTDNLGLGIGWRGTGNFLQDVTLDNAHVTTNKGINSNVHNFLARVAWRPNFKRVKEDKIQRLTDRLNNLTREVNDIKPVTIIEGCCDEKIDSEFIYFDFDKYDIKRSELAAAESAIEKAGEDYYILITGFACPRFGSDEYNYKLANRRVDRVADLCQGMGFPQNRMITEVVGKDIDRDSDNAEVRASARRVELRIIKVEK